MIRVGINGFGRIGRAIYRVNQLYPKLNIVVINDINPDPQNVFYTLKYDTLYGSSDDIEYKHDLIVNNKINQQTKIISEKNINKVNWSEYDIDYIIESSGVVKNIEDSKNLIKANIIKKIFATFSPNNVDFTLVLGCNEEKLDIKNHNIISTSICDAIAIAPTLKTIHNFFKIENGYITTLHPWLSYQNLMDGPSSSWSVPGEIYHHYALGRSVIGNLIPKPTSAIDVTFKSFNGISRHKIGSFSYRIPTSIVCSADISLNVREKTTKTEIQEYFYNIQSNQNYNIFMNSVEPIVSLDILKSKYSCTIDHRWTEVIDDQLIKLVLWYDNEWGYSSRVIDSIVYTNGKIYE